MSNGDVLFAIASLGSLRFVTGLAGGSSREPIWPSSLSLWACYQTRARGSVFQSQGRGPDVLLHERDCHSWRISTVDSRANEPVPSSP